MTTPGKQSGIVLLEGLIPILIFSLGILAVVGLQAVAVKQVSDSRYRSEAGLLANQLLGTMWVDDRTAATLQDKYGTGGSYYTNNGLTTVGGALPGTAAYPPTVVVDAAGTVTVTIKWLLPGEPTASLHSYVTIAQIK